MHHAQGASAQLDLEALPLPVLRLQLPHLPVSDLVRLAQEQAPHSFGQLGLASAAALELEP